MGLEDELDYCMNCGQPFTSATGLAELCSDCWQKENPCPCDDCKAEREKEDDDGRPRAG
jgi:hypothetical protein